MKNLLRQQLLTLTRPIIQRINKLYFIIHRQSTILSQLKVNFCSEFICKIIIMAIIYHFLMDLHISVVIKFFLFNIHIRKSFHIATHLIDNDRKKKVLLELVWNQHINTIIFYIAAVATGTRKVCLANSRHRCVCQCECVYMGNIYYRLDGDSYFYSCMNLYVVIKNQSLIKSIWIDDSSEMRR